VLAGFFVVWCIILVGWFVGRQKILGDNARQVLSSLTFFVASPALLFETLGKARLAEVFAAPLLVTAVAAIATASIFFTIAKLVAQAFPAGIPDERHGGLAGQLRQPGHPHRRLCPG
jgi:malonate transporter